MIHNITKNTIYRDVAEAAHALCVRRKDIYAHLRGHYVHINGDRLKYILPKNNRKKPIVRDDLRKPVRCLDTGRVYVSQSAAAKAYRVSVQVMSQHLNRTGHLRIHGVMFEWVHRPKRHNDLFGPIQHV